MKVLLICDHFEDLEGGSEKYVSMIKNGLEDLGHDVETLTLVGENSDLGYSSNKLFMHLQRHYSSKKPFIVEKIKETDPDIIHVNSLHYAQLPLMKAIRESGIPAIKTFHDYSFFCACPWGTHKTSLCEGEIEECLKDGKISILEYLAKKPLDLAKKRKVSETFKIATAPSKDLKNLTNKWIETKLLENCAKHEKFRPRGEIDNREGLLYIGRISEEKGLDIVLESLSNMERCPKLKVVGKGNIEKYQRIAEEKGIKEKVEFKGFLENKKLPRAFKSSKATIIPSKWRENAPLVLLESLASGTPVICPDKGGVKDYVKEGTNGATFKFRNSRSLRKKLDKLEKGKYQFKNHRISRKSKKFDLERHIQELIKIYEKAK